MIGSSRRHSSIALVLIFLAGAMGVPSLDALLFHRGGTVMGASRPHFEPEGMCCGHADRCLLMCTVCGPHVSLPPAAPRETSLPAGPPWCPPLGRDPFGYNPASLSRPRGPPAPLI